jgi:hypothetical protein
MRRRLNGIAGSYIARGFAACLLASLGMGIGLWFWLQAAGGLSRWVAALGGVVIGGTIYGMGVVLLRVPEVRTLMNAIVRRLPHGAAPPRSNM